MSSVRMSAMVLSPAMLGRLPKVAASKASIKRNLFGRSEAAKEHSNTFAKAEIDKHLTQSSCRWEFDFKHGKPMQQGRRFIWEKVGESYVNLSLTVREPAPPSVVCRVQEMPSVQQQEDPPASRSPSAYKQKQITDYLKPRKRRADDADAPSVSKMARINPAAAATATSSS